MAAIPHAIPELDRKGLRHFGLTTGAIFAGLFGAFFPWVFERAFPVWPWIILAVLGAWALVAPASLRPVYRGWMRFGLLLGKVTTPIVLGTLFYVVIVPVGFMMRLTKPDPLRRRFDRSATTYRIETKTPPRENLERPF